ncbi:hypothetical protein CBA19CS11_29385 [Caballeronia novacaledonica]|uniref:hypothetical protein n=1 Tax=Caballeronia novacaledonica TaxID=1544861 RepID=UPI001EE251BD|nr:hypothetical protein [Caballeronia novacaledonica]GJH13037.1 hypothetical protein CBA19CS11_29385 [Caballeronia novacaledonica]
MRADAIRLARVPARLSGSPGLRIALERWLGDYDPARHGLPPQAIVLVKSLRACWHDVVDGDRATRYAELAAVLRRASRPASGAVDGDAVWFADEAELLACIARDALSGALNERWWWRALARGDLRGQPAIARWILTPRHVPRAVQRLGTARAKAWFTSWTAQDRAALLSTLEQVFPLAPPVAAWVADGRTAPREFASVRAEAEPSCPDNADRRHADCATPPASHAERLQKVCADLAVDARIASTADYVAGIAATHAVHTDRPSPLRLSHPGVTRTMMPRPSALPRSKDRANAPRPAHGAPRTTAAPEQGDAPEREQVSKPSGPRISHARAGRIRDSAAYSSAAASTVVTEADMSIVAFPALAHAPAPECIVTRCGGLFLLLNAALRLRLYGDFTMPLHAGLACSPWRFLWLAGRLWSRACFRDDPLAAWFVHRDRPAGSQRTVPVPGDTDWRMDPAWLEPFAGSRAAWRARWRDGRFTLAHAAGFLVCDVAARVDECDSLIASETMRLGIASCMTLQCCVIARRIGSASRPVSSARNYGCPSQLWPYLHARLALALDDDGVPPRRRVESMLDLPGRLHDSGERLDLFMPLDALPVCVRLAGLDRDPGWIPAAGCDVRFHFG